EPAVLGAFGTGDFRWVAARIPAGLVSSLADQPAVEFIDPVQPIHPLNAETDWVIQTNLTGNDRYWTFGLNGSGQVIGMADTGLDYDGASFRQSASTITLGGIYNTTDPARRKVVRSVQPGRDSSTFRRTTTISSVRPGSSTTIRSRRCGSTATAGARTRMCTTCRRAWSMRSCGPTPT